MKQKKQFCTYSGNLILSSLWLEMAEILKNKFNVELPILEQF